MIIVRRFAIVLAVGFLILVGMQRLLSRDDTPAVRFVLTASPAGAEGWTFTTNEVGNGYLGRAAATVVDVMARLEGAEAAVTLTAADGAGKALWRATVEPDGAVRFEGDRPPADLAGLADRLTAEAYPEGFQPTRQVTIADVLAANLPTPTLSRVSFPAFSFEQAFPGDTYRQLFTDPHAEPGDEVLRIDGFSQAPMLADLDSMAPEWRQHYPASLPPVAQRLPRNPAVVRGPDGVGRYGGTWHRCTWLVQDLDSKIGYESFVRFDPSGRISPCLAYKWTVEDNNRVFTFYLRKGHRWSDGHPFTAHDIVWACNTVKGSDAAPSLPEWMQETDGRSRLYVDDVLDWPALVGAILREASGEAPSPGRQIARTGGERLLALLGRARDGEDSPELRFQIVTALNMAFREKAFFDAASFAHLDLDGEIERLEAIGFSRLDKDQLLRLNWLLERRSAYARAAADIDDVRPVALSRLNLALFREAYRPHVDIARLRFVRIEAVPDENGDDSHIVRFTFPKPNAIFLEKTATFMFYIGTFQNPKHYTAPFHPEGSTVLNTIDIYRWSDLFARLRDEAAADRPSAGRQLWQCLPEDVRRDLAARPPSDGDSQGRKQQIVDAINTALRSREFYSGEAWAGVDLAGELEALRATPYHELRMAKQNRLRFDELRRRADLLRRRGAGDDLTADERYALNLMLLRAAYCAGDRPLMAPSRLDALTMQAQSHPERHSTWAGLYMAMGRYDPQRSTHPPTLRAWRIVTDAKEQKIIAVRNPYYYRVDTAGNQLPYFDAVETQIETRPSVILLKMASGNVDFQVREIAFEHYRYLKAHEKRGGYEVRLWANDYCGEVTFAPQQYHKDPQYAQLQESPAFRHALSLAINRQEIIDVVYGGIGTPAQWSVPEGSPYYCREHAEVSVDYDPHRANAMLDSLGLDRRRADGIRLLPDGRALVMNLDTDESRPLAVVQMVCDYWRELGIDTRMQVRSNTMLFRMAELGQLDIFVHKEGGNFYGPIIAGGYAPTHPAESLHWSGWANFIVSGGLKGDVPPDRIMDLQRMWEEVLTAPSQQEKYDAWRRLSLRTAEDLPIMAVMTSPGKVVYVRNNVKNVPRLSLAGWAAHDPGNACPESFFFDPPQR
ncbi:MAG: hypothetical protein GX591_03995 [Planctomycetes bacterium]|nr:hypothetical protein [Planctomycetota bacterium]